MLAKIKSNFLASMSHELRTPFSSFYGLLDILGETPLDAGQREIGTFFETTHHFKNSSMIRHSGYCETVVRAVAQGQFNVSSSIAHTQGRNPADH